MATASYAELRPLLFSIAYRMVGAVGEAEDIVQEAFLRYHRRGGEPGSARAWLTTVTTRLAIDHLRSARAKREAYVGPWLPEPIVTDPTEDPAAQSERADSLSIAFLAVLERLSPVERAVFLLREVFDYGYGEIAEIVERSEDNCRQIFARARKHVEAERPRFVVSREQQEELTNRFLAASREGDVEGLMKLLAEDAAAYTDGGGKARAASRPVHGRRAVARFMALIASRTPPSGLVVREVEINGRPGRLLFDGEGNAIGALVLDLADGAIRRVDFVVNPDKLSRVQAPHR
jgi:RNA polymerase sigma-70 factor (ECF subfamily)